MLPLKHNTNISISYRFLCYLILAGTERKKVFTTYDKEVTELYKSSKIEGGTLLVLFLYASNEELRLARMHPEFCAADTTFGTNNEKKELFTLAFKDGNNKAFNGGRCFIPNAQKWVFAMMFKHCLPKFWGQKITKNVRLLLTDGCTAEYLPFILNIGFEKAFPKAVHGLCYYHLAIQGFKKNVDCTINKKNGKYDGKTKIIIDIIHNWVRSWFFDVEDEEEYQDSRIKLSNWINSQIGKFVLIHISK